MEIIADLQIHSKYARATSKEISIENLEKYAKIKGIDLLGTGDFQHPLWNKELKSKLKEDENGILWTKNKFPFIWQTEISLMYSQDGKGRRVHHLIFSPNIEVADQIIEVLGKKGRLDYDGRPIFGFTSVELVEIMKNISNYIEIIPAHAWTPWFSLFGSKSGFNSLKECFQDQVKHIYAIETGLSSDPAMNWRLKQLDNITLVSNSDAHCVHPDTLITLEDGYILPISKIRDELVVAHVDFKDMSYKNGIKVQYSKIPSPPYIKKIKYSGGEIEVSSRHRFYTIEKDRVIEKHASQLKEGDLLIRSARIFHKDKGSIRLIKPTFNVYFSLKGDSLNFIKSRRNKFGLTQKQIADLIGIYIDHYWKIEKGLIKINKKILKKISVILKFNYNTFIKDNAISIYPNIAFPDKSSTKLFELLGYFIGDGCFTKINRGQCLLLTDKNKQTLEYYRRMVKNLFSCDSRLFKRSSQNSYGLVIPSLVARFFSLNFPEVLLKSKKRTIPRKLYCTPLEEISGFLRGFFDAEGSLDHHGVKACSANKLLLYQIDSLLKKFDIFSSIYLNLLEKEKKKYRHNIILYGENLRKFNEKINFNHPIKNEKLKKYIDNLKIKRKSKIKRIGDFVISQVKSIRDVRSDVDYLYDISVPGYENYIANQLIVHNSFWPWRLGREATVFDFNKLTYGNIIKAIRTKSGLKETIEVDPNYGKYHVDGHRLCNITLAPKETKKLNNICPKCNKPLTLGVLHRVEELADRPEDYKPTKFIPFKSLIPLSELIAAIYDIKQLYSKKIWEVYNRLINNFGSEYNILLKVSLEDLKRVVDGELANYIIRNREGKLKIEAGYDGVYGKLILDKREKKQKQQKTLEEF